MAQAMVPSDVEVEDKILGPFTLKQFIYLAIGGMIIFVLYTIFNKLLIVFFLLSLPVGLLTFAFVFYKFNEQPFEQFLSSLISFYTKPKIRLWRRDTALKDIGISTEPERKTELPKIVKKKSLSRLDELAFMLDSQGWESINSEKQSQNQYQKDS